MIKSMTAFARTSASVDGEQWVIEIRSLNHKYFDFSLKAPQWLCEFEDKIREQFLEKLHRGKVSVSFNQEKDSGLKKFALDETLIDFYVKSEKKLKKQYGFKDELSARDLFQLPKVLIVDENRGDAKKKWKVLEKALNRCLQKMIKARQSEGKRLLPDFTKRLKRIETAAAKIKVLSKDRDQNYYKKLTQRVDKILKDQNLSLDQDRICKEIAILAERTDITEELVRLKSHLDLFRAKLQSKTEVGRELDFLCQELNREINTIGSKGQFFSIATRVIDMKKEVEKIREQVQNIE